MKKKKYILYQDLREDLKETVDELLKTNKKMQQLQAKLRNNRQFYNEDAKGIIDLINRYGKNGISKGDKKLYLRKRISSPSFRQVMDEIEEDLTVRDRERLYEAYESGKRYCGESLIVKEG